MPENATEVGKLCVTLLLSIVILFSFIKLLFIGRLYSNSSSNKFKLVQQDLVRLVGGSAVFLVAIVASNPWIYFVSFLIGGLLVASEQFMILLAGVLSSDRKNVFKIIKYVSELSRDEIAERVQTEAQEVVREEEKMKKSSDENKPSAVLPKDELKEVSNEHRDTKKPDSVGDLDNIKKTILFFERAVAKRVESRVVTWYYTVKRNVRIVDTAGIAHVHDIVILGENNKLFATAEIKLVGSMNLNFVKKIVERFNTDAQSPEVRKVLIFGFRNYDFDETNKLLEYRKQMKAWDKSIGIVYYQLVEDNDSLKLESINTEDMSMLQDEELHADIPF